MNKYRIFSWIFGLSFLLFSCIPSLHPIYFKENIVTMPGLEGIWEMTDSDETWSFSPAYGDTYRLIHTESGVVAEFLVHVVDLEGQLLLDIFPDKYECSNYLYQMHFFPVHSFSRFQLEGDRLQIRMLDPEWLSRGIGDGSIEIDHVVVDETIVLTASTSRLQKLILDNIGNEDAFMEGGDLMRRL